MEIKKLDVKIQQLCSDSVKGDIRKPVWADRKNYSLQRRAQHTAEDGNVCIPTKPNLSITVTPQTFKNFPVMEQNKAQNLPIWADASSRVFLQSVSVWNPQACSGVDRVELSHLAELSTHLPDCNNYRFQGHIH